MDTSRITMEILSSVQLGGQVIVPLFNLSLCCHLSPTSEFLEFCCRCMTRESPTLRSAAGFALALILEAKWRAADVEDNPQATAALLCELVSASADDVKFKSVFRSPDMLMLWNICANSVMEKKGILRED